MLRKILIVDDNEINRLLLKKILSDTYEVIEANNGQAALDIMQTKYTELSAVLLDIVMPVMDGFTLLMHMHNSEQLSRLPVIVTTVKSDDASEVKALSLGAHDFISKPYNPAVIRHRLENTINLRETSALYNAIRRDDLTGLYSRFAFFELAGQMVKQKPAGYYVLVCLDIDNFKVINDQYGNELGDTVLRCAAEEIKATVEPLGGICCRIMADHFAALYPAEYIKNNQSKPLNTITAEKAGLTRPIIVSIGRYVVDDPELSVSAMYDRATLAREYVKGRFDQHVAMYSENMRDKLLREQEIVSDMDEALQREQFEVWFQPQYNHATGAMVGSEALVRWRHPIKGMISPGEFIPVFERNGFVYELDKFVWERVCRYLRRWTDMGRNPLPVSVNASRFDILHESFFDDLMALIHKYQLTPQLLRVEVTESAFSHESDLIIASVNRLIEAGFTVEIDDFGSGYSSLNTLKDVPATVLKLDMRFLEGKSNTQRGGNILESIVRMAKWLNMSVIAEGVETIAQADYLRSIGCNYIQGYLYARPMTASDFEDIALGMGKEREMKAMQAVETLDNDAFWDPNSMDTLIFNSYVGSACIFEYYQSKTELLRYNEKYALEICGSTRSADGALSLSITNYMDEQNCARLYANIHRAILSGDESTCEVMMCDLPSRKGVTYLRVTVRVIAKAGDRLLLYASLINTTAQREAEKRIIDSDEQLRFLNDTASDLLAQADPDKGIISVLRKTMAYFGADQAFLSEYNYDEKLCYNRYYVSAPGRPEMPPDYDTFPLEVSSHYWHQNFQTSDFMHIEDVSTIGDDRAYEKEVFRRLNVQSVLAVSLREGNAIIGAMGVYNPKKHLKDYGNLGALGDYTAVILARRDLSEKIKNDNTTLTNLMNDTPGGFMRLLVNQDATVEVVYVNDGLRNMLSISQEDWAQRYLSNVFNVAHPDDVEKLQRGLQDAMKLGVQMSERCRLQTSVGSYIWVMAVGRLVRDSSGKAYFNMYFTDLTWQEKRALSFQEMLPVALGAMMESSNDYTFVKDRSFTYICCSQAFAKLIGLKSEKDITGLTDFDIFDEELASHYRADDEALIQSETPLIDCIEPLPPENGVARYSSTSKYVLRDDYGAVVGLYGVGRDVTKNREAYAQLKLVSDNIPGGLAEYEFAKGGGERLLYCNEGFCKLLGYEAQEYEALSDQSLHSLILPNDMPQVENMLEQIQSSNEAIKCSFRIRDKSGQIKRGPSAQRRRSARASA